MSGISGSQQSQTSPSSHSPSSMDQDGISPIFVVLLGIMSAAVVLTIYHCIVVLWCNSQGQGRHRIFVPGGSSGAATSSAEFSTVQLIPPAHAYSKGEGLVSDGQSTCPVCLCDFKDGDRVRLLPECMHCFHVPCIDMWLRSHSNCPMCRAETAPARHSADSRELSEIGAALE